jgi:transposase
MIAPDLDGLGFFPPEVRAQATAVACSQPQAEGVPLARWSYAEIAQRLVALGVVVSIATSTIGRWLRAERIKPWRYHLWQRVRDPRFLELAKPVLRLYELAQVLYQAGVWVVCTDEKTSIQARDGIDDPQPVTAGHPQHIAARYERRGAVQLFAGLSVAEGQAFGCCRERHCFVDFQAFILDVLVVEAVRRGVRMICLILDNGPTHAPKQLEAWLAEQQALRQWPFEIKLFWLPKYASWLDQVEIWFSILQRKVLSPNHFESVAHLKRVLLEFIQHYNRTAKPIQWSYTIAKLEKKFGDETQDSMVPSMLQLVDQLAAQQFSIPAYAMQIPCLSGQNSGRN